MPVSKLKNIAILVLLVADLLLLAFLVPNRMLEESGEWEMKQSLSALYEDRGIALEASAVPETRTLYALQLTDSTSAQVQAATALLGDQPIAEPDPAGWLYSFTAERGSCSFGREGLVEARLEGINKSAQAALEAMGVSWTDLRRTDGAVTVTQTVMDVPVFSDGLTLTYTDGLLTAVDGVLLCGTRSPTRVSQEACMTAADALVQFLDLRFDLGWVGTRMERLEQGYVQRDTASAASLQLTPVWKLVTDTDSFYLDGLTGEIWSIS
jgi:hypothetical protein